MEYFVNIDKKRCKQCGLCASYCPKNVFSYKKGNYPEFTNGDDCIGCKNCEIHCPDFAIEVEDCSNE